MILSTHNLSIGYPKKSDNYIVQSGLNLEMKRGELLCLIGPNGSGKSTLLRTLSGLQKPLSGEILIQAKNLFSLSHHEKSLIISMVLTDRIEVENTTVRQVVQMGRQPHTSWWGNLLEDDKTKVEEAMDLVHIAHKADDFINELSDGERQRAMIAKALAQDTPIILLDEPTAHLDLPNRVEIMLLLHRLAHQTGKAILLSTHELDIALQAADRIWLMSEKQALQSGVPEDLVLNGDFNKVFQSSGYVFNASNGNFSMNYPLEKEVSVKGDKTRMYWTLRALARAGYRVVSNAEKVIEVTKEGWLLDNEKITSVEELLSRL